VISSLSNTLKYAEHYLVQTLKGGDSVENLDLWNDNINLDVNDTGCDSLIWI